jgi:hypothetical protein
MHYLINARVLTIRLHIGSILSVFNPTVRAILQPRRKYPP